MCVRIVVCYLFLFIGYLFAQSKDIDSFSILLHANKNPSQYELKKLVFIIEKRVNNDEFKDEDIQNIENFISKHHLEHSETTASIYSKIAQYFCDKKLNYHESNKYFFKSILIGKQYLPEMIFEVTIWLTNVAFNYNDMGFYSMALKTLAEAEEIIKTASHLDKRQDLILKHKINSGYAYTYWLMNKPHESIKYNIKSYELAIKEKDSLLICEPLNGIGICANEFGKHDTALKVFLTELNIEKKLKREVYLTYYNIANTYVLMKQFHLAEQYLDSALKTKNEDPTFYLESLYLQMEISIKKGDIDKALKIRDRFFSFKDSLNNQEIKKEVAKMNAMYNLEKKELEKQKLIDEKKQQEYIIVASIITIILCFALVVFTLKAYRVKQKANIELSRKNQIIEMQKKLVEEQNKNITDSIHYASKIQQALLSSDEYLNKHLFELVNEYFVLYIPKDIVSGDFYWATKKNNYFYFVLGDSTGHGVPGAFMSLLNINFLNEAINDKNIPNTGEIFDFVKSKLNDHLHGSKDGMDASIIRWDINDKTSIQYSAANHYPILIPKDSNTYFKCENDKMPIGVDDYSVNNFRSFNLKLNRGDKLYIFTDGYADQFGGEKSRKLQKTKFYELLLKTSSLPLIDQKSYLLNFFYHWKGGEEQTDDVCIACFKF